MNSFTFYNPTRIHFGQGAVRCLANELKGYHKILLAYGGGSIKRNGVYDAVMAVLRQEGKSVVELSGIMPNPRTEKVNEGITLCKANEIEFILGVGGGSTIDCCKAIAMGAKIDGDCWQTFYIDRQLPKDALPVGSVLTLAATGSEMNSDSVISNWGANIKLSFSHPLEQPKFAIMDPTYTYSLPREQLVYGSVDILSHVFEVYFTEPDVSCLSDDLAEAVMRNVIKNLNVALEEPTNYTARANLMWAATVAINEMLALSKKQDWQPHKMGQALSAFYDSPHGATLSVVHPVYLEYIYSCAPEKFARYAKNVWNIDPAGKTEKELALAGIHRTREYFGEIGAPLTFAELGIPADEIEAIADTVATHDRGYMKITRDDVVAIYKHCL